jgi:hypothetical protein
MVEQEGARVLECRHIFGLSDKPVTLSSLRGAKLRSNPFVLSGGMDCFAEPVIGRAFARPVGSQ